MKAGVVFTPAQAIQAMKLQVDLMDRYGIDVNIGATDTAKQMLSRLVEDIILPNITDEQRIVIMQAILDDEELNSWVMAASE